MEYRVHGMAFEFWQLFTTYPSGSPHPTLYDGTRTCSSIHYSLFTIHYLSCWIPHPTCNNVFLCIHTCTCTSQSAVYMYMYWHACMFSLFTTNFDVSCWIYYLSAMHDYMQSMLVTCILHVSTSMLDSPYTIIAMCLLILPDILWQVLACNSCLCMFTVHVHVHAHAHVACMRWISLLLNLAAVL